MVCVRVCEDIVGVSTLGLVDRGFETIVEPACRRSRCRLCQLWPVYLLRLSHRCPAKRLDRHQTDPLDTGRRIHLWLLFHRLPDLLNQGDTIIKAVRRELYRPQSGRHVRPRSLRHQPGSMGRAADYATDPQQTGSVGRSQLVPDAFVMIAKKSEVSLPAMVLMP